MGKRLHNIDSRMASLAVSILAAFIFPTLTYALSASAYTSQSVLSTGNWVKISVPETGIYTISQSDLSRWGFSDISQVKIFGYGGAPLSSVLNSSQIDDLPQLPVLRSSDKIYFYAQGPTTWTATTTELNNTRYTQYQHPYATAGYYFITDRSDITPLSVEQTSTPLAQDGEAVTTFTDRTFHENELYSPGETGHYLLGEDFRYSSSQSFKFTLTDYVPETYVSALTAFAAKTVGGSRSQLSFQYNGTNLPTTDSDYIRITTSEYDHVRTTTSLKSFRLSKGGALTYTIGFSYSGTLSVSRLDYITINYIRSLALSEGKLQFRSSSTASDDVVYNIDGCSSSTQIWDVTKTQDPVGISATLTGTTAQFTPATTGAHEYVAFNEGTSFSSPTYVGRVSNQDLHSSATPDMIIISPTEYLEQAKRIATLHETVDTMRVLVVDPQYIYNEFSSGTPDVMAYRKLAKMFYDRGASDDGHKLGYMLLFGRGSYDNRQITSTVKNDSYPRLLLWQSDTGVDENTSYCSDDILGTLSDNSSLSNLQSAGLSIAVGRMPVKSVSEAKTVVDKLYSYVTSKDYGSWKNNIIDVADDGDAAVHMTQSESAREMMVANGGENYVYNRVFTDAYTITSDGSGNKYPAARRLMFQKLNDGALMLHYVGHANPVSWTHDGLLNITDMNNMYLKHYPLFYTATCEFTRLDANSTSGGEILFLNGKGGAISLMTAARLVYIPNNGTLTKNVAKYFFKRDAKGNYNRIGDILRLGKNDYSGDTNKLRYFLVGDPAMRLAYPAYNVQLETINGEEVSSANMPDFKARQTLKLKGSIYDPLGNKATGFNGTILPTLYDAEQSVETKGNQDGTKYVYQERKNKLAVTMDSVRNGEFTATINIPSEILAPESYDNYSTALLSFYAYSNEGVEANGSNSQFYIYGFDDEVKPDTIGPDISSLLLNSETFKDGDDVNESPMVIASVSDESGINFSSSGIGHQMTFLLDEKTLYSDVSSYYTPTMNGSEEGGNSGYIRYPLSDLTAGNHTLRLKVWDTFSNSSEKTISFNVISGLKPELYDVYTTANPASTEANFYIKHDRPDATITVTLSVFNLMGQEVWSTTQTGRSDLFTSFPITWDLNDASGKRVQRGIYLYKAGISTDGVQEATKAKKIAVAAQ